MGQLSAGSLRGLVTLTWVPLVDFEVLCVLEMEEMLNRITKVGSMF